MANKSKKSNPLKKLILAVFSWVKKIVIWFFVISIGLTIVYRFVPPPITPLMLIRFAQQAFSGNMPKIKKDWTSLEKISPNMVQAVLAAEDQHFTEHNGFDFKAIDKAIKFNEKKKGKRVKGASTISQQTAKNVFLWPGRTWLRKALEAYMTLLIETLWSKERIMEMYLNVIEMGNGIYGTQAAAQHYYHTDAKNLSAAQAAGIAAVLPNPLKFSVNMPSPYTARRKAWIMRNMRNLGKVDLE